MKSTTHVNFHAHHTWLKCVGAAVLTLAEIPVCTFNNMLLLDTIFLSVCVFKGCKLNSEGSNILPDLPNIFECHWEDCNEQFECMQSYSYHIAEHFQISEFKKYNFNCPWRGL